MNPLMEEGVKGGFRFFKAEDGASRAHHPHQPWERSLGQPFKVFRLHGYFGEF